MIQKIPLVLLIRKILPFTLLAFIGCSFFSSCKIFQPAYYFKNITKDTIITGFEPANPELSIQKNDVLGIGVSSLSPLEDGLFNSAISAQAKGFVVDAEGNIFMHKLGKVAVTGLSRQQLKLKLEKALEPFLKDPIVTVNFINHRVTVLGETSSQVVEMPEERIPLLEVMAKSNPVTQNSALNKVLVIREGPGTKEFKYLDLQDPGFLKSPWYYLQPNDVVVVKPNTDKINAEAKRSRNQLLYTTALSAITLVFLIIDRVFR